MATKNLISAILGIALLISSAGATLYQCDQCDSDDNTRINQTLYIDVMVGFYNSTCIETSNWKYVFINFSDDELMDCTGTEIVIVELKQLGPKSVLADVYSL
jgi:hypothetical protein